MNTGTIILVAVGAYFLLMRKATTTVIPAGSTRNAQTNSLLRAIQSLLKPTSQQQQPKSSGGGIGGGSMTGGGGATGSGVQGSTANLPFINYGTNDPQGIAINSGQPFRVPGGTWNADGTFTPSAIGSTDLTTVGLDTSQEVPGTGMTVGELYSQGYSTNDINTMLGTPPDPLSAGTYGSGTTDNSLAGMATVGLDTIPSPNPPPSVDMNLYYPADTAFLDTGYTDLSGGGAWGGEGGSGFSFYG